MPHPTSLHIHLQYYMDVLVWVLLPFFPAFLCSQTIGEERVTILISMDGFRHDYLSHCETPHFDQFIKEGVSAEALIPAFPTKTFPNHYTLVTGLYPAQHGIITNVMYDTLWKETFRIGAGSHSTREGKWFEGEPIWVTAEKQDKKAATFFWPGSDAEIQGVRPTYRKVFDPSIPYEARIKQVLAWLQMSKEMRPSLITLYFGQPDKEGHRYGPLTNQVREAVEEMDQYLGMLMNGIRKLAMLSQVNVLIVSDHGMAEISPERCIFLDDYIDIETIDLINWGPFADFFPKTPVSHVLEKLQGAHPRLKAWHKDSLPEAWQYGKHRRIPPILLTTDAGWMITTKYLHRSRVPAHRGGTHGYDPSNSDMWTIFLARGPAFRAGEKMPPVENIHIYSLLCRLLDIQPSVNAGDVSVFSSVLR